MTERRSIGSAPLLVSRPPPRCARAITTAVLQWLPKETEDDVNTRVRRLEAAVTLQCWARVRVARRLVAEAASEQAAKEAFAFEVTRRVQLCFRRYRAKEELRTRRKHYRNAGIVQKFARRKVGAPCPSREGVASAPAGKNATRIAATSIGTALPPSARSGMASRLSSRAAVAWCRVGTAPHASTERTSPTASTESTESVTSVASAVEPDARRRKCKTKKEEIDYGDTALRVSI